MNDREVIMIMEAGKETFENFFYKKETYDNNNLLKIIYGKIHGSTEFVNSVKKKINKIMFNNNIPNIIIRHNLSHIETCYEIATSDYGICWRKNNWGENGEISTKVLEYKNYGLEVLTNLDDFDFS